MERFDGYRWQDHTVRPGWWKLDLMLATVSIGVISLTFEPDAGRDRAVAARKAEPSATCQVESRAVHSSSELVGSGQPCESTDLVRNSKTPSGSSRKALAGPSS